MVSDILDDSINALLSLLCTVFGKKDYTKISNSVDWHEVYELSCHYGVSAVVADSIQQLRGINIEEELFFKWIGQSLVKDEDFAHHLSIVREFACRCRERNVKVYVLKGLTFSTYYPNPKHRPCGDIDVFCVSEDGKPAYHEGNEVARLMGAKVDTHWYKHSQIHCKGVMIENHEYLVCTREGQRYKDLNRRLTNLLLSETKDRYLFDTNALMPSTYFNALFQAYHSCSHFLSEGMGMKHVLDWVTFLQKEQDNIEWSQYYADCERYHLKRFVVAMTDIAVKKLGVNISNNSIKIDSPNADRLWNSVLYDDAKVFGTPGGAWNHRIRLVKNAFRYKWKFTEIAQESFIRHIIIAIFGFVFHTED